MKLDQQNKAFNLALDLVRYTNRNLFLTGKAGTGKTTFLKTLHDLTDKNMAIVAPTGVAAVNAGGVTIHSFFRLGIDLYPPGDRRINSATAIRNHFSYNTAQLKVFEEMELLVIDEVSMVRCEMLDLIDRLLKVFGGGNANKPFGGKQVLLIGDPFQLPPVAKQDQRQILSAHYPSLFFFSSRAFREADPVCIELQKIYRQSDPEFIRLLNEVRVNQVAAASYLRLNQKVSANPFSHGADGRIYLGTHNWQVNGVNERELAKIESDQYSFQADITGEFKQNEFPADAMLNLKVGAQVMFLVNDTAEYRYHNGKIGKVVSLENDTIKVLLDDCRIVEVERYQWKKVRYEWNEREQKVEATPIGTFTQYPLRLAWAITVHKSQGLSFERVHANLKGAFDSGQAYVGLSRCTSLEGLELATPIPKHAIKVDLVVLDFARSFQDKDLDALMEEIKTIKASALMEAAVKHLEVSQDYPSALAALQKALETSPDINLSDFLISALTQLLRQQAIQEDLQETIESKQRQWEGEKAALESRLDVLKRESEEERLQLYSKLKKQRQEIIMLQNDIKDCKQQQSYDQEICANKKVVLEQRVVLLENRKWWEVLLKRYF